MGDILFCSLKKMSSQKRPSGACLKVGLELLGGGLILKDNVRLKLPRVIAVGVPVA